ncbi:uncharacterized protein LOC135489552 isoform X2 [Lineus longissimus]|uniref:uncharacterized protein LOC135489552 isoform X2 n=1 Tax=Lineus longissimus TaxID=88925 RepID=UPI00315CEEDF
MESCKELIRLSRLDIEEALKADDVLIFFPEWKQAWIEKIRSLPTQTEQAREFLDFLLCEDEAPFTTRRFTQFLDALNSANYQRLVQLLRGEKIKKFDTYMKTLKILQPEIGKRLVIDMPLLTSLLAKDVITEEEKEQIWSQVEHGNSRKGLDILIRCLPRRIEDWPDKFIEALTETGNEEVMATLYGMDETDDYAFDKERIRKKNEALKTSAMPDYCRSRGDGTDHDSSFSENESSDSLLDEDHQTCVKSFNINNLSQGHSLEKREDSTSHSQSPGGLGSDPGSSQSSFNVNFDSFPEESAAAMAMAMRSDDSSGKSKMYVKDLQLDINIRQLGADGESKEYLEVDSGPMAISFTSEPTATSSPSEPTTNPKSKRGRSHRDHSRANEDDHELQVVTCLPESSGPLHYKRQGPGSNIPNASQSPQNSMQTHDTGSVGQNLGKVALKHQVTQNLPQKMGSMSLLDQGTARGDQEQHCQSNVQQKSDHWNIQNQLPNPHDNTPSANCPWKAQFKPKSGPTPTASKTPSLPVNPAAVRMPQAKYPKEKFDKVVKPKKEPLPKTSKPYRESFDAERTPGQANGCTPLFKKERSPKAPELDEGNWTFYHMPTPGEESRPMLAPKRKCLINMLSQRRNQNLKLQSQIEGALIQKRHQHSLCPRWNAHRKPPSWMRGNGLWTICPHSREEGLPVLAAKRRCLPEVT